MKNTKIVELVIDEDNNEALTIDAISLVHSPAIEENFVYFGKDKNNLTFAKVDEEKRMLVSPALIPNKQIFRYDPNTDQEYYVYFSPETVRKAAELYLKHNNHHKATYEHQDRVAGVLTVESWVKEGDMDKSKLYGFDLPNGTWFVKMKITNDELWDRIKAGEIKGLSIEGYFVDKMQKMSEQEPTDEEILSALNDIIQERTELKAKKIELGLVSDFKSDYSKAVKKSLSLVEEVAKISGKLDKIKKEINKNIIDFEKLEKPYKTIVKQVKDLGLDINEVLDDRPNLNRDIKSMKDALKLLK
ncbi:MAG: putative peptidase [Prokaryotic dsDNA virus sp.]|nr:MAG: putative peptidase [Prokaryotic dsDNA virus sp.]|tara:strand:+ start:7590 stop:8495 length:906 start_codon:yes stop_codon:yes gene_type:complete